VADRGRHRDRVGVHHLLVPVRAHLQIQLAPTHQVRPPPTALSAYDCVSAQRILDLGVHRKPSAG